MANAKKTPRLKIRDELKKESKDLFSQRLSDLLIPDSDDFIMTGKELAKKANISEGIISGYRQGNNTPSIDKLRRISLALGVSCDYLLGISAVKTHNAIMHQIYTATGLKEDAIDSLLAFQISNPAALETVNRLLTQDKCELLQALTAFIITDDRKSAKMPGYNGDDLKVIDIVRLIVVNKLNDFKKDVINNG